MNNEMDNENLNKLSENQKKPKFDYWDNYYWGLLAFFIPIIGAILVYFWTGKKEKSVKGISIGLFFAYALFLIIGVIYVTKG